MADDWAGELFESWTFAGSKAVLTDKMLVYLERPTLKHARLLLRSLDIPLPLKTIINAERSRLRWMHRNELRGGVADDRVCAAVKELFIIDTLHDLSNVADVVSTYRMIVGNQDFPKTLKDLYLAHSHMFTNKSSEYLCGKYGVAMTSAVSTDERRLVDQIIATRSYVGDKLEIVMDNLVAGLKVGSEWSKASIGLAGCAYVMILCHHLKMLGKITNDRQIVLYDGWFQNFDGTHIQKFIRLYIKSMKRVTGCKNFMILPENTAFVPIRFNKYLGVHAEMNVFIDDNKTEHPYMSMNGKDYLISVPGVIADPDLVANCENVQFPHNKNEFVGMVLKLGRKSKELWYMNFLRDCLKAEMAIAKTAIFLTHDRLAYLYYKLIGGQNGFLLTINNGENPAAVGVDDVVYRVTV